MAITEHFIYKELGTRYYIFTPEPALRDVYITKWKDSQKKNHMPCKDSNVPITNEIKQNLKR
jgi:hypothetical protein